jgi:hypothetical protein
MDSSRGTLTYKDFAGAALALDCHVAAVQAVAEVEAPRGAFLADGRPTILFERHVFSELTGGKWDGARAKGMPERYSLLSSPDAAGPGEYGPESAQHARLEAAAKLHREAALAACSWGMFQIMGRYHAQAGHQTLQSFVNAMYDSAAKHLDAFVALICARDLDDALRERRWADFARAYNGRGYKRFKYDEKLAAAFDRFTKVK